MPYVAPTLQAFRARFPDFNGVPDTTVLAIMADAGVSVSNLWGEVDGPRAIMLLTAHLLLVEGHVDRANGDESTITTTGAVSAFQLGDVRVNFAGSGKGGESDANGYKATEYGRRYLALMRQNFGGPVVV